MSSSKKSPRALLRLGDGLLLDQLERGDGDDVVQDDAVVLAEVAAVLDHGQERADAVRGDHRVHLHARPHAVHAEGEVLAVGAAVADESPQVGDELGAEAAVVRRLAEHDAVEVEQHGGAADQAESVDRMASRPFSSSTILVSFSCTARLRCSSEYCSFTILEATASVMARNGTWYGTSNSGKPYSSATLHQCLAAPCRR